MIGARLFARLLRHCEGATAVEFALISPVLVLVIMGLFDVGYTLYSHVMLQGAIQQAGRKSTVENAGSTISSIDQSVEAELLRVVPNADIAFVRKSYSSFSQVALPEDYTDANTNGVCDAGEPYEDANGNGTWDQDRGAAGLGGARDAVLYTVTMTYRRPFPMASLIGLSENVTAKASTVLRNQPYDAQKSLAKPGNCP